VEKELARGKVGSRGALHEIVSQGFQGFSGVERRENSKNSGDGSELFSTGVGLALEKKGLAWKKRGSPWKKMKNSENRRP
jgi:hypothetical protein